MLHIGTIINSQPATLRKRHFDLIMETGPVNVKLSFEGCNNRVHSSRSMLMSQVLPVVVMLTAFLLVGFVVARKFPISEVTDHRSLQVDGLRALLAFGVMTYHFFGAYHLVFVDGKFDVQWMHPVIKLFGSITVPVFFPLLRTCSPERPVVKTLMRCCGS